MTESKYPPQEENKRKIRVAIIGAGLSGLAVANGLLKDAAGRFDVQIYERDTVAFDSERGGYQLRLSHSGLDALKTVSGPDVWSSIREVWSEDHDTAPTVVDPATFETLLHLAAHRWYPKSRAVSRLGLRRAFLQPMLIQNRVHFNHTFERFELLPGEQGGVRLHFDGQDSQDADILIAADGSGSRVNRQAGINNKIKLQNQFLVQSRGTVSQAIRDKLPDSLAKRGPVILMGGKHASGYVSIYKNTDGLDAGQEASSTLFWALMISRPHGEALVAKAGNDPQKIVPHLVDYIRSDLGYGEPLAFMVQSATDSIRTGLLTSSFRPEKDWRDGIDKNSRIILLGDAIHPMPPTRGMGANQALTDASNLVNLFYKTAFDQCLPADKELAALVQTFEEEMFERTFSMVKSSEALIALDAKTVTGRMILASVGMMMTVVGWFYSFLKVIGLKSEQKLDWLTQDN
ncbi:hypothetical protein FAUST_11620 [Fusarium austroamericanum]|uniref:FAD-binding domain-containing protein n=1 Tax=Fusarium austroamericanum TaxID=282268 RepID=A0AAN5YZZ0_FUSAU|nr:hypothetical protein FAUST_11620 [Fusarium austroamericanum]